MMSVYNYCFFCQIQAYTHNNIGDLSEGFVQDLNSFYSTSCFFCQNTTVNNNDIIIHISFINSLLETKLNNFASMNFTIFLNMCDKDTRDLLGGGGNCHSGETKAEN